MEDDVLIDPRDTQKIPGYLLAICRKAEQRELRDNTFV